MAKTPRLNFLFFLFILFGAVLVWRLAFLQIVRGDFYRALSQGQQNLTEERGPERGTIFLEEPSGRLTPLATQRTAKYIFASPTEIQDKEYAAKVLGEILQVSKESMQEKLSREESFYEILTLRPTEEQITQVRNASLKGVYIQEQRVRFFPKGSFMAHVIGFVGGEGGGQYGIEEYYDDILSGRERILEESPKLGSWIVPNLDVLLGRERGGDIILTIDPNIQFFAEKLLKEAIENLKSKEGTIIVMDPSTGRIIALADEPSFDPNKYFEEKNWEIFQNSAVQKIFEPGSAFKPFTIAAALEEKKITPETTYRDEGIVRIGGYAVYNYDGRTYGETTMREVLEKSINTGAVFAERQLGHQSFLSYIKKFGFTEPTGIDLQGEVFSENRTLQQGREINFVTASFGQGIEVTPMQLVRAFSALINGGKLVKPFVVAKIRNPDGTIKETSPEIGPRVISQETSNTMVSLLVSVVENGFGKRARIPGYSIGGKTGTAQVPWTALGIPKAGYSSETIQSFVGFFPAVDPRFVVLVKLSNPKTKTAEYSAVPIFHDLAKYIIDYLAIPPDYAIAL